MHWTNCTWTWRHLQSGRVTWHFNNDLDLLFWSKAMAAICLCFHLPSWHVGMCLGAHILWFAFLLSKWIQARGDWCWCYIGYCTASSGCWSVCSGSDVVFRWDTGDLRWWGHGDGFTGAGTVKGAGLRVDDGRSQSLGSAQHYAVVTQGVFLNKGNKFETVWTLASNNFPSSMFLLGSGTHILLINKF